MNVNGHRSILERGHGHDGSAIGLIDRIIEDVALPLSAHRFGHSHDDGEAGGETNEDDILAAIRREAERLHTQLAHDNGIFVVELMGSTGSGKTTLLERIIEDSPESEQIGVIVGDVAGDDDASRYRELGVEVANVNTGKECHLDPELVDGALDTFDLDALDTIYVENVGNMVCPADFPLGAAARILVVSTTEGDDVVRKHPLLFQSADAAVINKTDIAEAVGADVETMRNDVLETAPDLPVFETAAEERTGIAELESYLDEIRGHHHEHVHHHAEGDHVHAHEHDHEHAHGDDHAHHHAGGDHAHAHGDDDHAHAHGDGDHEHDHGHHHDDADHEHEHSHVDGDHEHADDRPVSANPDRAEDEST
jgi:hydrogenase nickel incorporation protein HypB